MTFQLRKLRGHRRIARVNFLIVTCWAVSLARAQIAVRTDQRTLLLEMIDGLVDFGNHRLEIPRGKIVVLREPVLESLQAVLELCDVDVLRLNQRSSFLWFKELREAFRRSLIIGRKNCGRMTYIFG